MLVVVAIGLFILKGRWEESLRRDLEARASDFIGGRVTIERLRITVLPPAAWLETVRCLKVGNRGSRAEGSIPSIDLNAGLWDLIRGGEQPLRMTLHQPNVRLFLAEGREWFPTSGQIAGWFARTSRAVVG